MASENRNERREKGWRQGGRWLQVAVARFVALVVGNMTGAGLSSSSGSDDEADGGAAAWEENDEIINELDDGESNDDDDELEHEQRASRREPTARSSQAPIDAERRNREAADSNSDDNF